MRDLYQSVGGSMFEEMVLLKEASSARVSSWDRSGGNRDFISVDPGELVTLADIRGSGCIRHIYFTLWSRDLFFWRTAVVRMYWDGEEHPSVEVPLGDFFGVAHAQVRFFASLPLAVNPGKKPGGTQGLSAYFPMPFSRRARITLENQGGKPIEALWYHVDYDRYVSLPRNVGRFHAQWRRENPCLPS